MGYTAGMNQQRGCAVLGVLLAGVIVAGFLAAGRLLSPLQSPVDTPTLVPTLEPPTPTLVPTRAPPTPTAAPVETGLPTGTPTESPTPGPSPTPDTWATSQSVYATITALAATPTYPPTTTPHPGRTPIGAGPGDPVPTPTVNGNASIAIQSISQQVFAGGTAALSIKTRPKATCSLGIARAAGGVTVLDPVPGEPVRIAGNNGSAAWIWTVGAQEPAGIMRLVIDCGQAGRLETHMRVVK